MLVPRSLGVVAYGKMIYQKAERTSNKVKTFQNHPKFITLDVSRLVLTLHYGGKHPRVTGLLGGCVQIGVSHKMIIILVCYCRSLTAS